jgi:polar amino acid transport system substrate-binding protein
MLISTLIVIRRRTMMRKALIWSLMLFGLGVFIFANCVNAEAATVEPEPQPVPPLLIGVTADYPPMIFKQSGNIVGVEADLARLLAAELGRPVKFIELRWADQISALMAGQTDIIMSGMSVTQARRMRIEFSDPYLKSGLVAMMHIENTRQYNSIETIKGIILNIGMVKGTTSELFVRKEFPNAAGVITFNKSGDAPFSLKTRAIDLFVHDAPSIMWLVSENEADFTALWEPLNDETIAWGVRRNDRELLMKVNTILARWKQDGTLKQILLRWLPPEYLERFK